MNPTKRTLLEQMRVNEMEVMKRKQLIGLSEQDAELLKGVKDEILQQIDHIVTVFYEHQTSVDEIALLIGDADTLKRLKLLQRKYILELFHGFYDLEYVNNRLRIGLVHKRIGVEPMLYLASLSKLKSILCSVLQKCIPDRDMYLAVYAALDRLLDFDVTLIFDTYVSSLLSEIELSRDRAERYARSLEEQVAERTRQLEELSRRDGLTGLFNVRAFHEYLRRDLQTIERNAMPLSLIYLDVDGFKEINDGFGHLMGNQILKGVARVLMENCREVDTPCRYGGDEFCLILVGAELDEARHIAERIIAEFERIHEDTSLSIGIAQTGPSSYIDGDTLVKLADKKMYEAKQVSGSHIAL